MKDSLVERSWVVLAFVEHTVGEPMVELELEEEAEWVGLEW